MYFLTSAKVAVQGCSQICLGGAHRQKTSSYIDCHRDRDRASDDCRVVERHSRLWKWCDERSLVNRQYKHLRHSR